MLGGKKTYTTLALLLAGMVSMGFAILVLGIGILFPSNDSPILWDLVATRLGPFFIIGAVLVLLAISHARTCRA
jgi:hypothetical protein